MDISLKNSTLSLAVVLALSACSSDGGDGSTPVVEGKTITFSGIAVDGYIANAQACLDLDGDGACGAGEPKATTKEDGTFTFEGVEVGENQLMAVIVSGGTDTATGKPFVGELKNIVDSEAVNEGESLLVSPLTDLAATSFLASEDKNLDALNNAKTNVATSFGLSPEDVSSDPMTNPKVFATTQEVQQTKALLEVAVTKASEGLSETEVEALRKEVTEAYAKQLQEEESAPDLTEVFQDLEEKLDVEVPANEKEFVQDQVTEVKEVLEELAQDDTADLEQLNDFQAGLEDTQEEAFKTIEEAIEGEALEVVDTGSVEDISEAGKGLNEENGGPDSNEDTRPQDDIAEETGEGDEPEPEPEATPEPVPEDEGSTPEPEPTPEPESTPEDEEPAPSSDGSETTTPTYTPPPYTPPPYVAPVETTTVSISKPDTSGFDKQKFDQSIFQ